jgi:hypothetical protein
MTANRSGPSSAATEERARGSDQLGGSINPKNKANRAAAQELQFHALADQYGGPLMEADELEKLAADISKQGLLRKIALYQGQILDGRNRYAKLPPARNERVYAPPPSRAEHIRQVRARVQERRAVYARTITLDEFGAHRGTRVSTSFLKSPTLPQRRPR